MFGERPLVPAPRHDDRADATPHVRQVADNASRPASAPRPVVVPASYQAVALPKTATDAELRMMLGLTLLVLGFLLLMARRLRGVLAP